METKTEWIDTLAKRLIDLKREIDGKSGFEEVEQKVMEILVELDRIKTLIKIESER